LAAPVPTAARAVSTSTEVILSWAPTSVDTVSSACCAARAPSGWSRWCLQRDGERALGIFDMGLDAEDNISARDIRSSLAWRPLLSMRAGHGFDARAERSSNCATRVSISLAMRPTRVSMP